jgi:hypothetical protein
MWDKASPVAGTPGAQYLQHRGITAKWPERPVFATWTVGLTG